MSPEHTSENQVNIQNTYADRIMQCSKKTILDVQIITNCAM